MEESVTSWDIEVGDIISERGVISERWQHDYPDNGEEMNEFTRFIILSKLNKSPDNEYSMMTNATKFYFKVAYLYAIPEIREVTDNAIIYTLTDWEIDTEDWEDDGSMCGINGEEVTPREWIKVG
tara:strand:+ start:236 stop:610 length:375 start_codon:yes stop_codon:yes gene_type:complete